jgi:triosephosphate isomerase
LILEGSARKAIVGGNWKMHETVAESRRLALEIRNALVNSADRVDVFVCPPFISLPAVREALKDSCVMLGAQNCHWEEKGAFTGEISVPMLQDSGCRYVIAGHSERRHKFHEPDEWVCRKVHTIHRHGLIPVVCIGETLEERESGSTNDVVRGQILGSLRDVRTEDMLKTVIAYEPVWAIGTGRTATPDQAQEVHAFIRNILIDIYGLEVALRTRIQYGGSVKPENVAELMAQPDIDGALVGGASLDASSFAKIVSFDAGGGS